MRARRAIGSHPPCDQPFGYYKTGSRSSRIGLPFRAPAYRAPGVREAKRREEETAGRTRRHSRFEERRNVNFL